MDVAASTLDPGPVSGPVVAGPLEVRWLGRIAYRDAWALQHELVERRIAGEIPDQLLVLEHPAVLTLGRHAAEGHVRATAAELAARGIELIRVERGGEVTYHGPGQLVAYPILALSRRGLLLRPLVRALEAAMAETCASFGVAAGRRDGHPGCWCDLDSAAPRKIGALGIRVERGVTYHGIALNVDPSLADFDLIDPCGMPDVVSTSIARELRAAPDPRLSIGDRPGRSGGDAPGRAASDPRLSIGDRPGRSGGDARRGITPDDGDSMLGWTADPDRIDAPVGITGIGAWDTDPGWPPRSAERPTGRQGETTHPTFGHTSNETSHGTSRIIADASSDALRGIGSARSAVALPHGDGPTERDALTGIAAETHSAAAHAAEDRAAETRAAETHPAVAHAAEARAAELSLAAARPSAAVEHAARVFARAFADQLGAEMRGFGAVDRGTAADRATGAPDPATGGLDLTTATAGRIAPAGRG